MSRPPLGSLVVCLVVLVATTALLVGCSDDSGSPAASTAPSSDPLSSPATPSSASELSIAAGELIVFERMVGGSEDRSLYAVVPPAASPP